MKLNYKVWQLTSPSSNSLDCYSTFPIDMLRYDPAYIHEKDLDRIRWHIDDGGRRITAKNEMVLETVMEDKDNIIDTYTLIYVQIPGYLASIKNPTVERWASFGRGWDNFQEITKTFPMEKQNLREWVTPTAFVGGENVCLSLHDWVQCKTLTQWQQLAMKVRREAEHKLRNRSIAQ